MVTLNYPVRESPKHVGPGENEVTESVSAGAGVDPPLLGSRVRWYAYGIWKVSTLALVALNCVTS